MTFVDGDKVVQLLNDVFVYRFWGYWRVTREEIYRVAVAEGSGLRHVTLVASIMIPRRPDVPTVCTRGVPTISFSRLIVDYDSCAGGLTVVC